MSALDLISAVTATVEPSSNGDVRPTTVAWLANRVASQLHGIVDADSSALTVAIPQKHPCVSIIFYDARRTIDNLCECYVRVAGQLIAGRLVRLDADGVHRVLELFRTVRAAAVKVHGMTRTEAEKILTKAAQGASDVAAFGFGLGAISSAVKTAVDVSCWNPANKYSLGIIT